MHFLSEFHALLEKHLQTTVTDHFPQEAWKRLDEPEMIEEPNLDQYVMVRVLEDGTWPRGSEELLSEGDKVVIQYDTIRGFLESGAMELIM